MKLWNHLGGLQREGVHEVDGGADALHELQVGDVAQIARQLVRDDDNVVLAGLRDLAEVRKLEVCGVVVIWCESFLLAVKPRSLQMECHGRFAPL